MMLKRMGKTAALLLVLALLGCATTGSTTRALLGRNYTTMTDSQLQNYFRRLNDQIANEEGAASTGRFGMASAVKKKTPLPPRVRELQARRNQVRAELGRRGLMP